MTAGAAIGLGGLAVTTGAATGVGGLVVTAGAATGVGGLAVTAGAAVGAGMGLGASGSCTSGPLTFSGIPEAATAAWTIVGAGSLAFSCR